MSHDLQFVSRSIVETVSFGDAKGGVLQAGSSVVRSNGAIWRGNCYNMGVQIAFAWYHASHYPGGRCGAGH